MLAKAMNPNEDNVEIQDCSQGNNLVTGIQHSPLTVLTKMKVFQLELYLMSVTINHAINQKKSKK